MKPLSKSSANGLAYEGAISFALTMPRSGNSAAGRSAVAASGIASVIHQTTTIAVTPSVWIALGESVLGMT